MKIELIKQIDEETMETWKFNMFDTTAVFVFWSKETKPKGKRVWKTVDIWDKYGRNNHGRPYNNESELPEIIAREAFNKVVEQVRVKTWKEWKGA